MRGEATEGNIALRCRRHNQYEAEVMFGDPARPRTGVPPADRQAVRAP